MTLEERAKFVDPIARIESRAQAELEQLREACDDLAGSGKLDAEGDEFFADMADRYQAVKRSLQLMRDDVNQYVRTGRT